MKQNTLDDLAEFMEPELREKVHFEMSPCSPDEFLDRYCEYDPDFRQLADEYISYAEETY